MHRSFISFTKQELKICVLLKTFLKVTSLLEITIFLAKVIDLKAFFLKSSALDACIGGISTKGAYTRDNCFEGSYIGAANIGNTCNRRFYTINPYTKGVCTKNTYTKSACIKGAYTKNISTKSSCTNGICTKSACLGIASTKDTCKGTYIKSICIRGTYIADPYAGGFWVKDACIYSGNTYIGAWSSCDTSTYIESANVNNVNAVKRSRMHLQFFQNLEVGSARLEIRIGVSCTCIVLVLSSA